ncbi:MAG TPA: hypothetical protein VFX33_06230 [Actinomycetales bacterium]|nr:hypothetical protein [Actinomycetales bacterium]
MAGAVETDAEPAEELAGSATLLRPHVADALATEPGPELLAAVLSLMADGHEGHLSARERLEVVAAWDRIEAFARAGKLTAIGDLDTALHADVPDLGPVSVRPTANELAPVLRIAPRTASALVALTRRARALPAAMDALAEGRLIPGHLDVLDQVTRDTHPNLTQALEAEAIACAPAKTRQQLHEHLASKAAEWDPDHATNAVQRGVSERDVQLRRSPLAGCHRIVADLPSLNAFAAWHALNGTAKNTKAVGTRPDGSLEERGLPALRADALAAILTGQADPANPALSPAADVLTQLAQVQVVVAADTLAGTSDLPAHLPAGGPIDPDTVRDLATRVPWRRLVAHSDTGVLLHRDTALLPPPTADSLADDSSADDPRLSRRLTDDPRLSQRLTHDPRLSQRLTHDPRLSRLLTDPVQPVVLDYGTSRYRSPAHLRDHVVTRDATCIGPACHHPAAGTQLDHTINYKEPSRRARGRGRRGEGAQVGTTADHNLGPLCTRWHNAKTHGRWRLRQPEPGLFIWTSPLGRTYTRRARPLVPGWRTRNERPPPHPM